MPGKRNSKYRTWSAEDMKNAFDDVTKQGISIAVAARDHNVPRRSLGDRVHGKVDMDARMGAPTKLSENLERDLLRVIDYMACKAVPLTVNQIIMYAWVLDKKVGGKKFGENGPSYNWWVRFRNAYPETTLKLRRPDRLDRARITCSTVDNLREYFQLLRGTLERYDLTSKPERIFNADETMIDLNKSTQRVVVPARHRHAHSTTVSGSQHVSMLCCVSASGYVMPPNIIFKEAFPGGDYSRDGPDGCLYSRSNSGFIDGDLMIGWFNNVFLKHCPQDRSEENPVLLIQDGHASHHDPLLILKAIEEHVILLELVPHTTHICQPLDVCVYKSLKSNIGKFIKLGQALRGSLWIPKKEFPRILKTPFEQSMTMHNIKQGFKKCGIFPFNPNAVDKEQLVRSRLIPSTDVDLAAPPQYKFVDVATQVEVQDVVQEPPDGNAVQAPATESRHGRQIVVNVEVHRSEDEEIEGQVEPLQDRNEQRPRAEGQRPVNSRTIYENPLVKFGVVSAEVAEIFYPADEIIPVGRKVPVRGRSKARILTSEEVKQNYEEELKRVQDEQKKKEERKKKRAQGKEERLKKNAEKDKKKAKTSKAADKKKERQVQEESQTGYEVNTEDIEEEEEIQTDEEEIEEMDISEDEGPIEDRKEDYCHVCGSYFYDESPREQKKWAGCSFPGCDCWCCRLCLPERFDYDSDYFCDDHQQPLVKRVRREP